MENKREENKTNKLQVVSSDIFSHFSGFSVII